MRSAVANTLTARAAALAVAGALLALMAFAPVGRAAAPTAGAACAAADGKISGRGSTAQTWLQYDLMGAYAADVCGRVSALAIPGATYTGTADGGTLTFTVSSDGTLVDSYSIGPVYGQATNGTGCVAIAEGDAGVWPGTPLMGNAFAYQVGTAIIFSGMFNGAQSASGTFRLDEPPGGGSAGCDTGTVDWTAMTTATPRPGDITDPGTPIASLPNGQTFGGSWMTAYNYPSAQMLGSSGANAAIGSGAGESAIGCRAEAFAGSDIPVTATQFGNINGAVPAPGGVSNGGNCDPVNGATALTSPFQPLPTVQGGSSSPEYPNPGDQQTSRGVMLFPIGISAVSIFANLPSGCVPSGGLDLSTADMEGIWGGSIFDWNQITDAGLTGSCVPVAGGGTLLPITRVVRSDNSGTTQAFDNYMADAFGYSTATCANSNANAQTFGAMQGSQATHGTDVNWPGGSLNGGATATCSALVDNAAAGGPALISTVEQTSGAVGYADYADVIHDTNGFQSQVSGDAIAQFGLQASTGATGVQPNTGIGGSNCTATAVLPSGGTTGAVGRGGTWDLTAQTGPNQGVDDIAYAKEGATYPICSLLWDFVWAAEDGNTPPAPSTSSAETLPAASGIPVGSVAGLPNAGSFSFIVPPTTTTSGYTLPSSSIAVASVVGFPSAGSFTVLDSAGTETLSYTGITTGAGNAGTLTGVSGGTGGATIASGATVTPVTTPIVMTNPNAPAGPVYTLPTSQITVNSALGLPYSGSFTVADSAGIQTLSYTGIDGDILTGVSGGSAGATIESGATLTSPLSEILSYSGIAAGSAPAGTLEGVTGGDSGITIPAGATLTFAQGTGGPEANLTADQRRTVYSYFTYLMSPAAQSSEVAAGYAPLPAAWLTTIRLGFQTNF